MTYAPLRDYTNNAADAAEARDASDAYRATQCPPCTGRCNQGRQCAANTPAEPCTELGADATEAAVPRRSAWSPAVNVVLIVLAFALAMLLGAFNKHKYAVIVLLVAVLPLVMVFAANLYARFRG